MVGKLKHSLPLIFPGSTNWEIWNINHPQEGATSIADPSLYAQADRIRVALPLHYVLVVPLWLPMGQDRLSIAQMELEMRGIKRGSYDISLAFTEVLSVDSRLLTLAYAQIVPLPENLIFPNASYYDLAARWLPLQDNAIHFWKELGNWCVALTKGSALVSAQSLGTDHLNSDSLAEVYRMILRLQSESILRQDPTLCVWLTTPTTMEREVLKSIPIALVHQDHQAEMIPVLPATPIDLVPVPVKIARKKKESLRKLIHAGWLLLGLYVLLVLFLTGRYFYKALEIKKAEHQLAGQQADMSELKAIADQWNVMRPTLDASFRGIDLLFICAQMLPEQDVRLTSFVLHGQSLQLSGEARTVPLAFEYIDRVKKNPDLIMFRWEAPQPTILPNNSASFQIVGLREDVQPTP